MTGFFMAWGMFCAIPCPVRKWDSSQYPRMLLCLPLIGLMLGGLWALAAWGVNAAGGLGLFGPALLCVLPSLLSGCIHVDGYMDCADAVCSRRELEKRREILKDSHVGAFAVIALGLWLLLSFGAFASLELEGRELVLLFLPAVSRSCSATAVLSFLPLSTSGYAAMPESVRPRHRWLAAGETLLFSGAALLFCGRAGLAALVCGGGSWLAILGLRHNLQGMSGDISGAAITIGELCALGALVFL